MTKDNLPLVTEVQFSFQQSGYDSRLWQSWPQNALPEFEDFCRFAGSFPGYGPNSFTYNTGQLSSTPIPGLHQFFLV